MKYNPQLDGLRCIAICFVLIQHFAWMFVEDTSFGFYGVDLFFAISGFLITSILLRSEGSFWQAYKRFFGRRTLRIFPVYYLTIFILLLVGNDTAHAYTTYLLTYTMNYGTRNPAIPAINELSHTWSLCVEEQFYLLWPFVVLGLRKKLSVLKPVIAAIILVCGLQFAFEIIPAAVPFKYQGLFPRAYTLAIGAFGAVLYRERKLPYKLLESRAAELVTLLLFAGCLFIPHEYNYLVAPLLSLFLIFKTAHKGYSIRFVHNFLQHRWVVCIGTISYGIYIYHKVARFYFEKYVFEPYFWKIPFDSLGIFGKIQYNVNLIPFPLYTGLTILVAHFSFRYIEKPILSVKEKWFPYKRGSIKQRKPAVEDSIPSNMSKN